MRPLIVSAHMARAFVATDPWSPILDAILAYETLRKSLGDAFYAQDPARDGIIHVDLPLERRGEGEDWYWACSVPEWDETHQHLRYTHGRFDDRHERYIEMGKARKVTTGAGRYKDTRLPLVCRLAPVVRWHVVGCETCIRELLYEVTHIAKKRGAGHGLVNRWEIAPDDRDRSGRRWVPSDQGQIWGIRPPYWHMDSKRPCVFQED